MEDKLSKLEDRIRRLESEVSSLRLAVQMQHHSNSSRSLSSDYARIRYEQSQRDLQDTLQRFAYDLNPDLVLQEMEAQLKRMDEEDKKRNDGTTNVK